MLKKVQKGFTLIELMIVVAIIGILAAIAIPAYQDYTIRAQVSEGLTMASASKAAVSEFFADNGTWPDDVGDGAGDLGWDDPPEGKYVGQIQVDDGNIVDPVRRQRTGEHEHPGPVPAFFVPVPLTTATSSGVAAMPRIRPMPMGTVADTALRRHGCSGASTCRRIAADNLSCRRGNCLEPTDRPPQHAGALFVRICAVL